MLPDKKGRFGAYGGKFVPETIIPALEELEKKYRTLTAGKTFGKELDYYLKNYVGRPTPLFRARNFEKAVKGPKIYLKREDLAHTGSHKINNTIGQVLIAKKMGKKRIIAETGAGQHGVATATASALFGLKCEVYMGEEDIRRQALNVYRMKLLGAKVLPVSSGSRTLKDAINQALRDWVSNVQDTHYVIGSVVGPHPYPEMVRNFQSVIGREARMQVLEAENKLPDYIIACVGGGSNSMGIFHPFIDTNARLIGVEAGGLGLTTKKHGATLSKGRAGVLHGSLSYLLQDRSGQVMETHSISAGLDYPGVGPEHSYLKDSGRAEYFAVTDKEALNAFRLLSELEGIIPALESSHAAAYLVKNAKKMPGNAVVIVNLSGRGDKDMEIY